MTARLRLSDQELTRQVLKILVGCGLSQNGYSISGGQNFYFPQVLSVVDGPPKGLIIRILPGQHPEHYAKHARTIAYNLDLAEVKVVPLGPYEIRLDLLPKPASRRTEIS